MQKKERKQKRVLVGGCFDILHFGHVVFLDNAKKAGTQLFVALESDEFIRVRKKREPVHTQKERAFILQSLQAVDEVVLLPPFSVYEDYLELVKKIKPDIIAMTENDPQIENKKKQAKEVGAKVIVVTKQLQSLSSSSIHSYAPFSGDRHTIRHEE